MLRLGARRIGVYKGINFNNSYLDEYEAFPVYFNENHYPCQYKLGVEGKYHLIDDEGMVHKYTPADIEEMSDNIPMNEKCKSMIKIKEIGDVKYDKYWWKDDTTIVDAKGNNPQYISRFTGCIYVWLTDIDGKERPYSFYPLANYLHEKYKDFKEEDNDEELRNSIQEHYKENLVKEMKEMLTSTTSTNNDESITTDDTK